MWRSISYRLQMDIIYFSIDRSRERGYSEIVDKYTCTPVHQQTTGQHYDGVPDKWAVTSENPVPRPGSTGRPLNLRRIIIYLFIPCTLSSNFPSKTLVLGPKRWTEFRFLYFSFCVAFRAVVYRFGNVMVYTSLTSHFYTYHYETTAHAHMLNDDHSSEDWIPVLLLLPLCGGDWLYAGGRWLAVHFHAFRIYLTL